MYPGTKLFIDGRWLDGSDGQAIPVLNPASGLQIGSVARASAADVAAAVSAAHAAFEVWRDVAAYERYRLLRGAAALLRDRADSIARILTLEQGKPLSEARKEILASADIIDWFAEEGRRAYGRTIPSRIADATQAEFKEQVGPVAAFTPWNLPVSQAARKIAAALAAGCSVVLKGPEETPGSCAALVQAFAEHGLPNGLINLLFGSPWEISSQLISHPLIRKISFTGSTVVGKQLAMLAGQYMKRTTMELGGHAPALVFADADLEVAARILAGTKYRNAGQLCVAPSRVLVQKTVYPEFLERFVAHAKAIKVGDGLAEDTQMGPVAHEGRLTATKNLVADALSRGGEVAAGGVQVGSRGYFFSPTVLTDVPTEARAMNEEPFGPIAVITPFTGFEDAIREANRLPYGLAAYAYTRSAKTAAHVARKIECGMISINYHGLGLPEVRFGGIKDSGHGSEGGADALDAYLNTKYVSQLMT
jgi:succinate-semialdehyde dehydrogenase/glutarate-semialdehyde dehydrogenase